MEEEAEWNWHNKYYRTRTRAMGIDAVKEDAGISDQYGLTYLVGTTGCVGDKWENARAVVTIQANNSYHLQIATTPKELSIPLENHAEIAGCYVDGIDVRYCDGPTVSLVASGNDEICILADVLGRISMELKQQLKTRTAKENRFPLELFGIIPRRKKVETKPKPIERPPIDPVNPDEIEPEELDETQWEIIKKVETAHARSFCKLANQEEVENGQLDRNVCDGERQHAERIPTDAEGEPGA